MSGHSRWAQIKHKKASTDAKRGNLFSKLVRAITLAARGGADPAMNARLRLAIDRAREANMPADNIERAVKKASSPKESDVLAEVFYEAYGPGGSAILIEGITDNKNRTASEIKHILSTYGGKLAESGAVSWLFDKKTVIRLKKAENPNLASYESELRLIDAGAEDIEKGDDVLTILVPSEKRELFLRTLENSGFKLAEAEDAFIAKNPIREAIADARAKKLIEALEAEDDVESVWSNIQEI